MKRKKIILITLIILTLLFVIMFVINKTNIFTNKATQLQKTETIELVPTMRDTITTDSSWCGTFQLVWNDMKNEVVKKDIVFKPQIETVKNLNKEEFNQTMISKEDYYKTYGLKTLDLKKQIENSIKDKFNQTSNVLEDIDWSENALNKPNSDIKRYIFYTMLYKKFEFLKQFDKLEDGKFGNKYNNIKYFGIDKKTNNSVRKQIEVLYYNSKNDFAIVINTKSNDEVIYCKNPIGNNFNEIYENMKKETNKYTGSKQLTDNDEFKAPNLTFNVKKEYTELENKEFETENGIGEILKAIQTIEISLDEKGGEIKSEAIIDTIDTISIEKKPKEEKSRYFYVDDTFAIFLKEKEQDVPYFAGRIQDITKFQ